MAKAQSHRDTSIATYRAKRDFSSTAEPPPKPARPHAGAPIFVVQKHRAHRAGLHWDFRLEHGGVLWSWAVPRGPSLDPDDRRMAIHVEDHPIDYADFQGSIPEGEYGAGEVETWDRGTWEPLEDPEQGMRAGHLRFLLHGRRLSGRFTLARLKRRDPRKQEAWFLIKGHDQAARIGGDAFSVEQAVPLAEAADASAGAVTDPGGAADPPSSRPRRGARPARRSKPAAEAADADPDAPAAGAARAKLPETAPPQLCDTADEPPDGEDWISEIKFDGYRLIVRVDGDDIRLLTRKGLDWAKRVPALVRAVRELRLGSAIIDGELIALRPEGLSSFPDLQKALREEHDERLLFAAFDLLYLDGWDLRRCALLERKRLLASLSGWQGMLRYSDHQLGRSDAMRRNACRMNLEGIICKRAASPYVSGRGSDWLKVKCGGREELIVIGWTPPSGRRKGFGALHLGYYDPQGQLQYAGGVGTGFSDDELDDLSARLARLRAPPPADLQMAGDPIDPAVVWVCPEIVIEVHFLDWSGFGRVRQAVFLGEREDKVASDVVRPVANPEAERRTNRRRPRSAVVTAAPPASRVADAKAAQSPSQVAGATGAAQASGAKTARPVAKQDPAGSPGRSPRRRASGIVIAAAPKRAAVEIGGVEITHPDRPLWPGITKQDLAEYWRDMADVALPGIARRPLAILRCPDGIDGKERFFQKHSHGYMPEPIREGSAARQPFMAIDDTAGLIAMAQMSAIELHVWGAAEHDPTHPDQIVFDLDPGEGVPWSAVIAAAHEVRDRLQRLGLGAFCRTSGGKGLHVVSPLAPEADWDRVKPFCRAFAEAMAQDFPERYVAQVKIADRRGRILVDWLRNALGATAVASFCPRARPGAHVATPIAWDEVTDRLDPSAFSIRTIRDRLSRLSSDPWAGFAAAARTLPDLRTKREPPTAARRPGGSRRSPVIVVAPPPRKRR